MNYSQKKKKKIKKKRSCYELVYGIHALIHLIKAKRRKVVALYTTKPLPKAWQRLKPYLPTPIPPITYVTSNVLSSMAKSSDHRNILALTTPFPMQKSMFETKMHPLILLLDGVQDVGNVGAILRSAYCTGVDGVVLCQKGGAPLTPAVFNVSAGLAEHLPIYRASSMAAALQEIRARGYICYMTVPQGGQDATTITFQRPACLVIGNEAIGISKHASGQGMLVTLPQRDPSISYNASVAAGIFLFLISYKKD